MSTFNGQLEEIPGISVDCFNGDNLNSQFFFLSHCHTDHEKGLDTKFFENLSLTNRNLYCSKVTKMLLEDRFKINNPNIVKELSLNCAKYISPTLTVTCIPSGHCLGSVMYLFEKDDKLILYTGDFRINPKDYSKLKPLHTSDGIPKQFNRIYLDTTFLNKSFSWLPSREESMKVICEKVKKWLEKDEKNIVILECSANYGSEYLYIKLAKYFNTKIHVKYWLYDKYKKISEISPYVTNNSNVRIHACKDKRSNFFCGFDKKYVLVIVPSTQYWRNKNTRKISEINNNKENVCYSMHSSYQELVAFIKYFPSHDIYPCVDRDFVKDELRELSKSFKEKPSGSHLLEDEIPYDFALTVPRLKDFNVDDFTIDDDDINDLDDFV